MQVAEFHLEDHSDEVLALMDGAIARALEAIGIQAEAYAKEKCPVDTGRLRSSISHTRDDSVAYIGTNVEYAAYVELGTQKTKAQPYLRPAAENHGAEYMQLVREQMRNA